MFWERRSSDYNYAHIEMALIKGEAAPHPLDTWDALDAQGLETILYHLRRHNNRSATVDFITRHYNDSQLEKFQEALRDPPKLGGSEVKALNRRNASDLFFEALKSNTKDTKSDRLLPQKNQVTL